MSQNKCDGLGIKAHSTSRMVILRKAILAILIVGMLSAASIGQQTAASIGQQTGKTQQLALAATITKNPNVLTYQNSTYGVKIQYPSSWGVQTGVNVFDEKGNLVQPIDIADIAPPIESDPNAVAYFQIGVEQQLTPADTKNIDLYLRSIINGYRFNSTDFHLTSATTHATLAGRQAYSLVFTDVYQGFPTKTMIRGVVDGDKNYYLLFTAEAAKFDSFIPTVQKMISSFELSLPSTSTSTLQPEAGITNSAASLHLLQHNRISSEGGEIKE